MGKFLKFGSCFRYCNCRMPWARMIFQKINCNVFLLVFVEINGNGTHRDIVGDPSIPR